MPERTSFGIIRGEFVILSEFRQTSIFKSGNAERACSRTKIGLGFDDYDHENAPRSFDGCDVPVIGVHVPPVFPPVSSDARVDADACACQQRDVSRGEERCDSFYRCGG